MSTESRTVIFPEHIEVLSGGQRALYTYNQPVPSKQILLTLRRIVVGLDWDEMLTPGQLLEMIDKSLFDYDEAVHMEQGCPK